MKKNLFLSMIAVALSFGAFAQDSSATTTTTTTTTEQQAPQQKQKDVYVFKNSKMWEVKSGQVAEMTKEVTLENGTVIKTNGEVVPKDGQAVALKDGQYIDLEGKIGETTKG